MGNVQSVKSIFSSASPKYGAWVDFLRLLLLPSSKDVGIFAGKDFTYSWLNMEWQLDRILGCVLCFALFMVGAHTQSRSLRKRSEDAAVAPKKAQPRLTEDKNASVLTNDSTAESAPIGDKTAPLLTKKSAQE